MIKFKNINYIRKCEHVSILCKELSFKASILKLDFGNELNKSLGFNYVVRETSGTLVTSMCFSLAIKCANCSKMHQTAKCTTKVHFWLITYNQPIR